MSIYNSRRGMGLFYQIFIVAVVNTAIGVLLFLSNSYVINVFSKILCVVFNLYMLYYIALFFTVKLVIDEEYIYILGIFNFKKVKIPIKDIEAYTVATGKIKGVRLSGVCNNNFALGRSIIDKIGVTRMFVTSNEVIIYIKTPEINYAISPKEYVSLENLFKEHNIPSGFYEINYKKNNALYKDKKFIRLFLVVSIIIIIMTLNPFILYIIGKLPRTMPLNYDAAFKPLLYGTSKQFAFRQMVYGALNMIVLFCMYYASYFHAKYDKKSSFIYIYMALIVSIGFLGMQFRILSTNL
ncbi:PH domain-containing protein [Haloimpatiens lingqiaonensis]|uniref:PH domain-containing protein n=1 Tax=Haloimpatiens lingqiaonensis TaxID=1380675 RepID=UPI0010FDB113|nr:PH domain-containing protein [Haloimpatiens lingqiaonensis]